MTRNTLRVLSLTLLTVASVCHCILVGYNATEPKVIIKTEDLVNISITYGKLLKVLLEEKQATKVLNELKLVQSGMAQIEQQLHTQYDDIVNTLNTLSMLNDVKAVQERFNRYSSYINYQYKKLASSIDYEVGEVIENVTLQEFAREATGYGDNHLPNYVREFVELISPSGTTDGGLLNLYLKYVENKERQNDWCDNTQSVSDFIYKTYRYTLEVVTKGYLVILESYAVRKAFDEGNFNVEIRFTIDEYQSAVNSITNNLNKMASGASVVLRRCDPPKQEQGKTYLELTKFIQGYLSSKLTMNAKHTAYYDCEAYQNGTAYYPYKGIKSDGEWTCRGLMYNCFHSHTVDICKPSTRSRRLDGFTAKNHKDWAYGEKVAESMGNLTNCNIGQKWTFWDWDDSNYFGVYSPGPCACLCDDMENPDTLLKFSRHAAFSDYKNNMVVTGIRLVNRSNVIGIDIQQGKLEEFGFINQSTVHWRSQSEIMNEEENSHTRPPITLSYHQRRISLDQIYAEPDEVLIGAAFELNHDTQSVLLTAFVAKFSLPTGELYVEDTRWMAQNDTVKSEVKLSAPHIPTLCKKNVPIKEANKFITFQPTDWRKDAAQTTVPYLDIQEVTTNPPTVLRGVGLHYRNAPGCGGFVGLELYSHDYANLIYHDDSLN